MLTPQDGAPPLIALLNDTEWSVRYYAAYALYILAAGHSLPVLTGALDPLVTLLDDEDSAMQHQAAKLLGLIGDERALPALREAAQQERSALDTDWMAHQAINAAIKGIGNRQAPTRQGVQQLIRATNLFPALCYPGGDRRQNDGRKPWTRPTRLAITHEGGGGDEYGDSD